MKNWRLLLWSLGAFAVYFILRYAPLLKQTKEIVKNAVYDHPRVVGFYVLAKIGSWFLLLFGTLGLLFFFYHLLKSKN